MFMFLTQKSQRAELTCVYNKCGEVLRVLPKSCCYSCMNKYWDGWCFDPPDKYIDSGPSLQNSGILCTNYGDSLVDKFTTKAYVVMVTFG